MKKDNHRTIKLDGDVANIAAELASQRRLSSVLSELLRREYGITFEQDLIKSQMNELQRQKEKIDKSLLDLQLIQHEKEVKQSRKNEIQELEKEYSLLKLNMDREIEEARKTPIEDFDIITEGLEAWEITKQIATKRGSLRIQITQKYESRREEIEARLEELKSAQV